MLVCLHVFPTICLFSEFCWFHGTGMLFCFPVTRMPPLIYWLVPRTGMARMACLDQQCISYSYSLPCLQVMIDVPLIYWLVPRTGMAKMVCLDVFPTLRLVCSRIRQNVKAATSDIESTSSDPNRLYKSDKSHVAWLPHDLFDSK